jgi:23S rRNA pseudouridine2457 synthase
LTDDGGLIRRISDPAHHLEKTYWAMVEGIPSQDRLELLAGGIQIRGYRTMPAEIRLIEDPGLPPRQKPVTPHGPTSWLEIKLHEGKKHQIRHMTAAVGLFTLRLVRVAIGPVKLNDLPAGAWRELEKSEIQALRSWRGYNPAVSANA